MGMLFGGAKVPQVQSTPVTPRLSDAQIAAKMSPDRLKPRKGLEDQILSLGKNSDQRSVSMLGRTAA